MTVHRLIDMTGRPLANRNPQARGPQADPRVVDYSAHNVTITALTLALAKHFVVTADDATAQAFIAYFTDQSRKMAAQTNVPAIVSAAEDKTSQLAGMLLARHREAKQSDGDNRS